jgi:hypothetical protein
MQDRADPHVQKRALDIARLEPLEGASLQAAAPPVKWMRGCRSINRFGACLPSQRKRFTSPTGSLTLAGFPLSVIVAQTSYRF